MVSIDPIDGWGEYTNYLTVTFLEVAHYVDGSRWSQFLVGRVAGLHHTHCSLSVDDGEALASYSLLKRSVSTMSILHVITDVQMRGLIKPHKWKRSILNQFMKVK